MCDDPEVGRFTPLPSPMSQGEADCWDAGWVLGAQDGTRERFAVLDDDGAFAGIALAMGIDREAGAAELGYAVVPGRRGRGVATEALRALVDHARAQGLTTLRLRIDAANAASRAVARRVGFECTDAGPDGHPETWRLECARVAAGRTRDEEEPT